MKKNKISKRDRIMFMVEDLADFKKITIKQAIKLIADVVKCDVKGLKMAFKYL